LVEGAAVEYTAEFDERKGKYRAEQVTGGENGGGPPARPSGVCYDHQKGNCTRGGSCRFSHDDEGGGGGKEDFSLSKPALEMLASAPSGIHTRLHSAGPAGKQRAALFRGSCTIHMHRSHFFHLPCTVLPFAYA
jgi:hypothetical protein